MADKIVDGSILGDRTIGDELLENASFPIDSEKETSSQEADGPDDDPKGDMFGDAVAI